MPYPPKNAYGQTTPETALEPKTNASVIGTGNADTVPGTANDAGMIGFPMPPFNEGVSDTEFNALSFVVQAVSASGGLNVRDPANWDGDDANVGALVRVASLQGAIGLTYDFSNAPDPDDIGEAKLDFAFLGTTNAGLTASVSFHQVANPVVFPAIGTALPDGDRPVGWTPLTTGVTTTSAVSESRSLDVTAAIKAVMNTSGWAAGNNRMNLRITLTAGTESQTMRIAAPPVINLTLV